MKKIFLMMIALFLVTALASAGLATEKQAKKGDPPNYKELDKPDPEDPVEVIKLDCKTKVEGIQYAEMIGQPSKWTFSGTATNKTGKAIPKGKVIEYSFYAGSGSPGTFLTNKGLKISIKGKAVLSEDLAPNGTWYLANVTFVTKKSPANVVCGASYTK